VPLRTRVRWGVPGRAGPPHGRDRSRRPPVRHGEDAGVPAHGRPRSRSHRHHLPRSASRACGDAARAAAVRHEAGPGAARDPRRPRRRIRWAGSRLLPGL